ncbi:amino acid adenylation domain-containing protein [Streptomyces sp. NPDC018045]|uniref:amino acid adenylation domain-containing protein n=1 Tax=Streptomyces sp. NPDC018045 TaxID=3365037 RepID=UPI0037BC65E0
MTLSPAPAGPVPLSSAQQQAWLISRSAPEAPLAHVPVAARLRGALDPHALAAALRAAAAAQPSLGERFRAVDGVPVRTPGPVGELPLAEHDVSALDTDARASRTDELVATAVRTPFDPAAGPLARACLVRCAADDHLLVVVVHRLVGDATSAGDLLRDTAAAYRAASAGIAGTVTGTRPRPARVAEQAPKPPEPEADLPPVPELPLDRARPARRDFAAGALPFELPAAAVTALRNLGASRGAGLPAVLLALQMALLHRYSGQPDIVVTTPAPARATDGRETITPVRVTVAGTQTLRELAGNVQRALDGAGGRHAGEPGERPVPLLAVLGRPGFAFHTAPPSDGFGTVTAAYPLVHNGAAHGDLELRCTEDGGRVTGHLVYAEDVFDRATARRVLAHYTTLADGAAREPGRTLGELPLLTAEEERTVTELNGVAAAVPDAAFHQLFEAQAGKTPDAVAVRSPEASLTYGELNHRANQLADLLREAGTGPEVTVGICMDRCVQLVVAALGVLKAGGAYVPVDPRDPAERRAGILDDAAVRVVIARDPAAVTGYDVIALDAAWSALEGRPGHDVPAPPGALDHAAYLLYTSGSTGRPKGVVVENRQLVAYTYAVIDRLGIDAPMNFAMVQPLTVDSSVTALVPPLCTGGEVHLLPHGTALDAGKLADWAQRHRVDCLKIAPSHLRALQASPRFTELLPRRVLVVGGEASDWRWLSDLQRLAPHCRVFNHYGPTETTVGVLTLTVADHLDAAWDTAPIGVPLPGTQAYVVDADLRPVPSGVPGELLIGGGLLARGYHRRDDLTTAAFVPDTLGGRPGARLYRTGDFVRRLPDGTLAFLGRRDDQIKVRGFRVALGEIEAALTGHTGVRDAVAVIREDTPGDRRVVAYVAPHAPAGFAADDLARHLRERLSPHMIPQATVVLDTLPLTPHGKVDRGALPAPAATAPGRDASAALPRNELERRIAGVWQDLLPAGDIGVEDHFFDIGGHSLLLVELQHRLQAVAGREIDLLDLFEHTSVRAQAAYLSRRPDRPAPTAHRARTVQHNALMKRRQQQLRAKRGRDD